MTYNKDSIQFAEKPLIGRRGRPFRDLSDQTFTYLTVLGYAGLVGIIRQEAHWWCICKCGTIICIRGAALHKGHTQSCGCLQKERASAASITHGESVNGILTSEYLAYHCAKGRCQNPNNERYADWGRRGIEFRFTSFEEFIQHIGRKPSPKLTLERKDVNGHYEIGNVEWATWKEQNRNKRNNHLIIWHNQTKCVAEWSEITGIKQPTIRKRLLYGYCVECTLTLPLGEKCPHR